MRILELVKRISIDFGLYTYARRWSRRIRKKERIRFENQCLFYDRLLGKLPLLCFDVGANIGEKTEALLALGHQVVSFEPNDDLVSEIRARCGGYSGWESCQAALGAAPALARLHVRDFIGQASLLSDWGTGDVRVSKCVPMITIDMAASFFGFPYFLKIDTEGYDLEVIKGLSTGVDIIAIEFHLTDEGIKSAGLCLERINRLGEYEINICDGESQELFWGKWMPIAEFIGELGASVTNTLGFKSSYGDIYCRRLK
jgi:FkbM family methyltransferase